MAGGGSSPGPYRNKTWPLRSFNTPATCSCRNDVPRLSSAWSAGTATKYRQPLTALTGRLDGTPVAADVAALDTEPGSTDVVGAGVS